MRIALVSGFWGQNIGNAFFNLGGKELLTRAGGEVTFVQDMPAYATFRNEKRGSFENALAIYEMLDIDLLVLQGPLFTKNFASIWMKTLQQLREIGIEWAVLGGAFRKYDEVESRVAAAVISEVRPRFISTRDRATYAGLREVFPAVRSGVDSAWFLPEAHEPPRTRSPFVTFCFDHFGEPALSSEPNGAINLDGDSFRVSNDKIVDLAASRGKAAAYVGHGLRALRRYPTSLGEYQIIRPEHRTNPYLPFKIYHKPNSVASDEPWTYLTLYGNTRLTLSDRVHACVATMAYGGEAMLHNPATLRHALFEVMEAGDVTRRPTTICQNLREKHLVETVSFLAGVL